MQSCQENLTKFSSGAVDESQKLFSCGWSKDKILGRRPNHSVNLSRTNNIFPLPSVFSRIFPPSAETQKATFSKQQYKFNGIVLHDFFFLPLEREKDDSRLMSCHSSYGIILISRGDISPSNFVPLGNGEKWGIFFSPLNEYINYR